MKKIKKWINKVFEIFSKLSNLFIDNHIFAYASQASFFVIISAVPFAMLLLNILQAVMTIPQQTVENVVLEFLPVQVHQIAYNIIADFYSNINIPFVSVTTIFLIWTASRGVNAISSGLKVVFNTNDDGNYFKSAFFSLVYTVLFIVVIIAMVVAVFFGGHLVDLLAIYIPGLHSVVDAVLQARYLILLIALTLFFMSAYKLLGKSKIKFLNQFSGAFLSSCFWLIFSYFYSVYIQNMGRMSYIYGSLAAIVFLMLWLWFCMISMLLGAQFNRWIFEKNITLKSIFTGKLSKT